MSKLFEKPAPKFLTPELALKPGLLSASGWKRTETPHPCCSQPQAHSQRCPWAECPQPTSLRPAHSHHLLPAGLASPGHAGHLVRPGPLSQGHAGVLRPAVPGLQGRLHKAPPCASPPGCGGARTPRGRPCLLPRLGMWTVRPWRMVRTRALPCPCAAPSAPQRGAARSPLALGR